MPCTARLDRLIRGLGGTNAVFFYTLEIRGLGIVAALHFGDPAANKPPSVVAIMHFECFMQQRFFC